MSSCNAILSRAAFVIGAGILSFAACAQPVATSGTIVSTTVDVTKPAASPLIKLHLAGNPTMLTLTYQGPLGESFAQQFSALPSFPKTVELQGYVAGQSFFSGVFSLYTEPGAWFVSGLDVCVGYQDCTYYTGAALSALFPSLAFTVINPNTPDITPPVAVAASIRTPTISITNGPALDIGLYATDDVSGLSAVTVCATGPAFGFAICAESPPPTRPLTSAKLTLTAAVGSSSVAGTYSVNYVYLQDIAGNYTTLVDPTAISKLFRGKTTFTVTN